jgi:uncharacterized protein GlcG (DUF336 family)
MPQNLTLALSNQLINEVFAKGAALNLKPLSAVVLDAGGHVIAFQRQDGASMLRFEIASGKAYGALSVGMGSRWLGNQAKERAHFLEGLSAVSGGRIVPVAGGVLIKSADGTLLGALGVSGDTSDNDEIAAVHAITLAGLTADAG